MKHKNRIFNYKGNSVITNMDFSKIPLNGDEKNTAEFPIIPHSVASARIFETKEDLKKFTHDKKIRNAITVKCAYDPSAHVGLSERMVARNAIFGNFGDKEKTPFIVEDLKLKGKGNHAYFLAYTELTVKKTHNPDLWKEDYLSKSYTIEEFFELRKKMNLIVKRDTIEFTSYKWVMCKIPVNSVIGTIIYWSTFLDNPDIIPVNELKQNSNYTIKFPDKRPRAREKGIPDGTQAGKKGVSCVLDNTPKKYYSVKFVDSETGEIHWKRQNNCQLVNVDIDAEIKAGNIIAL